MSGRFRKEFKMKIVVLAGGISTERDVNFGVLPAIEPKIKDKKERYAALAQRALASLEESMKTL